MNEFLLPEDMARESALEQLELCRKNKLITEAGIECINKNPDLSFPTLMELFSLERKNKYLTPEYMAVMSSDEKLREYYNDFRGRSTVETHISQCITDNPGQCLAEFAARLALDRQEPVAIAAYCAFMLYREKALVQIKRTDRGYINESWKPVRVKPEIVRKLPSKKGAKP